MSDVWTIERHLEAGSACGRALFHRFVEIVAGCGGYTTAVAKTTITFKGPEPGPRAGEAATRRIDDPRATSVAPYQQDLFVRHFRIDDEAQLDDEFAGWIADAYDQVGCGTRFLTRASRPSTKMPGS